MSEDGAANIIDFPDTDDSGLFHQGPRFSEFKDYYLRGRFVDVLNQDFAVYILGLDRWAMINRFQEIDEIEEDIKNIVATIKNVTVTLAWMDEAVARLKWVRDRLEDAEGQSREVATIIQLRPLQKRKAGRPRKNTSKASK